MMTKYTQKEAHPDYVIRSNADGSESWIPKDEANSDYQRYLRWLENPDADESGTL